MKKSTEKSALHFGQEAQDFRFLQKSAFWQFCKQSSPKLILDLGCGAGSFTSALIDSGCQVVGLDYNPSVLRETARHVKSFFAVGSGPALPFAENSFAAVLCLEVLSHIPFENQVQAVQEISRVLTPAGRVAVSVHNPLRLSIGNMIHGKRFGNVYPSPGATIYPLSPTRLESLFYQAGFKKAEKIIPINFYNSLPRRYPSLKFMLRPLENGLQKLPLLRHFSIEHLAFFTKP